MLILTRYNNERIVVIAPDGAELWVTADYDGLWIFEPVGEPSFIESLSSASFDVSGQKVVVTYLNRYGKVRTTHRIGIDAPKDYLILREELIKHDSSIVDDGMLYEFFHDKTCVTTIKEQDLTFPFPRIKGD